MVGDGAELGGADEAIPLLGEGFAAGAFDEPAEAATEAPMTAPTTARAPSVSKRRCRMIHVPSG